MHAALATEGYDVSLLVGFTNTMLIVPVLLNFRYNERKEDRIFSLLARKERRPCHYGL